MAAAKVILRMVGRPFAAVLNRASGLLGSSSRRGVILFAMLLLALLLAAAYLGYSVYGGYLRVSAGPFVHPTSSCSASNCHSAPSKNGKLYVAVDGVELSGDAVVEKDAGEFFEIDFHFTGVRGDPRRFSGVGVAVEVPADPTWRVSMGSLRRPGEWSADNADESKVWSPTWDRSANGRSGDAIRWQISSDKPNVYYLDFSGSKRAVPKYSVSANDLGKDSEADVDGLADRMGVDAIVSIPGEAKPGSYNVVVMAVGHDADGRRVNLSRTIAVKVSESLPFSLAVERGRQIYTSVCVACHGLKGNKVGGVELYSKALFERWNTLGLGRLILEGRRGMPGQGKEKGGSLGPQDARAVVFYLQAISGAPSSTSLTAGESYGPISASLTPGPSVVTETVGVSSEGGGSTSPPSSSPGSRAAPGSPSTSVNKPPSRPVPGVPHETAILKECLTCHGPGGLKPVPETHERRTEENCLDCHKSALPQAGTPKVAHKLERREWCQACHLISAGPRPLPLSHRTRTEESCLICHTGPPTAKHAVSETQTDCRNCHTRLPKNHEKRKDDSCASCHSGPITLPAEITAWLTRKREPQPKVQPQLILSPVPSAPTQLSGPPNIPHQTGVGTSDFTNCLTCHGSGGVRPVPPTHARRSQETCLGCHKVDVPQKGIPSMAHKVGGHEMCLSCHGPDSGFKSVSSTHATRGEDTCTICHRPPPRAKHEFGPVVTGCFICHHSLSQPHAQRGSNCVRCHEPQSGAATPTPTPR